ncbi:hepatocyte growth factor-regulated tyrosine kinase substrate [Prorops nasuta]|uniref:hepatocyte growth factor-regulated tyrosine kinase substrate n=1 Tax=Prorops nasuta TaxID=863751 RepID=UPI0034CFAB02
MFRMSHFNTLLEKATTNLQLEPDWPSILQICDLIRQSDVQPKIALTAIKKKLTNSNPHVALYALMVLESCVKNCGSLIHDEIGTKQYMEQLKEIVKTTPNDNVRNKILELIQAWAFAFRNSPKYRAVHDTVNVMKIEGYKFPTPKESDAMFLADTAPEWADGDVCHRCRVTFTVVLRKHHCRACGQVFCGQCSNKTTALPKFGIEKEVRVCEACYEQVNKPATHSKETDLPAEYLNSSLAQQQQIPPRKTAEELQEEEELHLALALSQSEAEQKEKDKKRVVTSIKMSATPISKQTYSPPPSPGLSHDEEEVDPELAKYLNRKMWEQRQAMIDEQNTRVDVISPSAPNIGSPKPQKAAKQQNGEIDTEMEAFVGYLKSQLEIFVNRMKSNSSRGRSIANDSSVQTLFMNITQMHSKLLRYIQEQDDSRVYYEGLQDKLTQIKDARAALDALREEHREKLRKQAEEAERQRQMQMANKLAIMRKKKQEYLQYQRQLALQTIQEQEREMQMRQEQQKQQYIMGGYQAASGYMGPSQGSPIRHVQYQGPTPNYHPMSPTNQGMFIHGQHPVNQYSVQGYNMPPMNSLTSHITAPISNQEQQDSSMGRASIKPGMLSHIPGTLQKVDPPNGHQMSSGQQGVPGHVPPGRTIPGHMITPSQGSPNQLSQLGTQGQINIPQQMPLPHVNQQSFQGPLPGQIAPGPHNQGQVPLLCPPGQAPPGPHASTGQINQSAPGPIVTGPPNQVMGIPPQMIPQAPTSTSVPKGPPLQQHAPIQSQVPTTITVPVVTPNSSLQGMQPAIPSSQGQPSLFPPTGVQPMSNETAQSKEALKPETAELISFD